MFLDGAICLIGLALHVCLKWAAARRDSTTPMSFVGYLQSAPAKTLVAGLAAVGAFLVLVGLEWMNPGAAFASGYMGNSIADNLARQFAPGK